MPTDIARFLEASGFGIFDEDGIRSPGSICVGIMPEEPDELILVNGYAGRQSIPSDLVKMQRPGLQIMCRSRYYPDAEEQAQKVNTLLDEYQGELDGTYYQWIRAIQSPYFLEQDQNGRIVFVQNFYTDRRAN